MPHLSPTVCNGAETPWASHYTWTPQYLFWLANTIPGHNMLINITELSPISCWIKLLRMGCSSELNFSRECGGLVILGCVCLCD